MGSVVASFACSDRSFFADGRFIFIQNFFLQKTSPHCSYIISRLKCSFIITQKIVVSEVQLEIPVDETPNF